MAVTERGEGGKEGDGITMRNDFLTEWMVKNGIAASYVVMGHLRSDIELASRAYPSSAMNACCHCFVFIQPRFCTT